jgi:hypothetical protein
LRSLDPTDLPVSSQPRLIHLGGGLYTQLDEADSWLASEYDLLLNANGYVVIATEEDGSLVLAHRMICRARRDQVVDHIDGDRLNNTRANLRVVSPQVNQANRKKLGSNNTSGIRGVAQTTDSTKRPWRAQITVNGRKHHLGFFATQDEAVAARVAAEREHYGEECPR